MVMMTHQISRYKFIFEYTKSLMVNWLGSACQGHEMCCHDLEVMGLNPSQVELGVSSR